MKLFLMLAVCRAPGPRNLIVADMISSLRQRGHQVDVGIAQDIVIEPGRNAKSYDLFVLKSHSNLWLSLAGALHQQGARILNSYPACNAVHNKIVATQRLQAAGIPIPDTWVTADLNLLKPLLARKPLVIKPYIGGRGAGVCFIHRAEELDALPPPQEPIVVQEFVPGNGEDLKVYVIRDQVFAVRKPFSPHSYLTAGHPTPVTPEIRQIALDCGRAFGLGLYGMDVIEGPNGPRVVDLNYFPSYRGVPGAAEALSDYISSYAYGSEPAWLFGDTLTTPAPLVPAFSHVSGPLL